METLQGTVSNCQHTLKVSGGANNTGTSTTYIALFRVNGRPVEFRTGHPSSISDGDQVKVAGTPWNGTLSVLACRNLTTGETANAGAVGYLFGACLLPVIGFFVLRFLGDALGGLIVAALVLLVAAITAYLAFRAVLTIRAEKLVNA